MVDERSYAAHQSYRFFVTSISIGLLFCASLARAQDLGVPPFARPIDASLRRAIESDDHFALEKGGPLIGFPAEPNPRSGEWTLVSPPARYAHGEAYDSVRRRMMIFGGYGPGPRDDMWALDLDGPPKWEWVDVRGPRPYRRVSPALVHDPVRDEMIVFGGGVFFDDEPTEMIWVLPLSGERRWRSEIPPGTDVPDVDRETWRKPLACFDPVRDRLIVSHGFGSDMRFWALSLGVPREWQLLVTAGTPPSPGGLRQAVYDPVDDALLVLVRNTETPGQLWRLALGENPPLWSEIATPGTGDGVPGESGVFVLDAARRRVVSHGGYFTSNTAWALELDGVHEWTEIGPPNEPFSPRIMHAGIFDPVQGRLILHGGYSESEGGHFCQDAWELSFESPPTWTKLSPPWPAQSGRVNHTTIYDPVRDRVIAFGGFTSESQRLNEVWALSLWPTLRWSKLETSGSGPWAMWGHSAIYDPVRDRMIVFSGREEDGLWSLGLSDLVWSGPIAAGPAPGKRHDHSAIYDPVGDRMILFGGERDDEEDVYGDLWELSLADPPRWTQLFPPGPAPAPRMDHAAIYDPVGHRMLIHAGLGYAGTTHFLKLGESPAWEQVMNVPSGAGGISQIGVYDSLRRRAIFLLGGARQRTLELSEPMTWSALSQPGIRPSANTTEAAGVYDPVRDRVIVFGGAFLSYYDITNETWVLDWPVAPGDEGPATMSAEAEVSSLASPRVPSLSVPSVVAHGGRIPISWMTATAGRNQLDVYDTAGRRLGSVLAEAQEAGEHELSWDSRALGRGALAPGVYLFRLETGDGVVTRKSIVLAR